MTNEIMKGFRDYSGEEARKRERVREIIGRNFRLFGFEPVETPIIEQEDFVKKNSGDEVISDVFRLQDKGKRNFALRYEFTFQLERLARNKKLPYRVYQTGSVFRDEPVSKNRMRQFTQCDADIIGAEIRYEGELLAMAEKIMRELGIKIKIFVNNRKLLNEILDEQGIKNKEQVLREIDKLNKLGESRVKENLKKLNADKILTILKKPESFFKKYNAFKEIEELKKSCSSYGVEINFLPSLARGLSYYCGNVFEIKAEKMMETIAAGGGYAINGIKSTGISFGLERLSNLAKVEAKDDRILVISVGEDRKAMKLCEKLRKEGINCFVMFGKPSKALDYANSAGISFVVFLGKEEVKKGKIKLKNMRSGKENMISEKELVKKLLA